MCMNDFINSILLNGVLLLVNPFFYLIIAIIFWNAYKRIKDERYYFKRKVKSFTYEWKQSWFLSLIFFCVLSWMTYYFNIVFPKTFLITLFVILLIFTLIKQFSFLSAIYTIGLSYFISIIISYFTSNYDDYNLLIHFSLAYGLLILLLLFIEVISIYLSNENHFFARKVKSIRGLYIGAHQLKRGLILPFFVYIPVDIIEPIIKFISFVDLPNTPYQLIIFPFVIGYQFTFTAFKLESVKELLLKPYSILFILSGVLLMLYTIIPNISFAFILILIVARECIVFYIRMINRQNTSLYNPSKKGLKVLSVIPNSTAEEIGLQAGEIILKVNGKDVQNRKQFYKLLQEDVSFYKFYIEAEDGEYHYVTCPKYDAEHYELGIIFSV